MTRCILGIDPGASGAIAFYFPDVPGRVSVDDMPLVNGSVCCVTLAHRIAQMGPTEAIVELVGSMPKQGVSSTFKFGASVGAVHGVLGALAVPYALVTPGKWKRRMGLGSDKEQARALALRTFPAVAEKFSRKKDHGRAEAALLAYYAAHIMNERDAA
ncbi:MAG: hypothetical protein LCH88_09080 [Proteobacteria bacterium]|nr:hypothetical protein [Pseudomonadota bacterium]